MQSWKQILDEVLTDYIAAEKAERAALTAYHQACFRREGHFKEARDLFEKASQARRKAASRSSVLMKPYGIDKQVGQALRLGCRPGMTWRQMLALGFVGPVLAHAAEEFFRKAGWE